MKKCRVCLIEKKLDEFYNRGDRKHAKRSMCIDCHSARRIARYAKATKDEEFRKQHALCSAEWRKKNIAKAMFIRARSRAKNKNLDFNITIEDIQIPEFCPILGIKLEPANGLASDNSPSLDRIDSNLGYIKENIIVCSYRANRIKNDSSFEEIEKLYSWILERKKHERRE